MFVQKKNFYSPKRNNKLPFSQLQIHINKSSQELSWQDRVRFFSGRFLFIFTWHTYMLVKFEKLGVKWTEGTPWHTALLYLPVTFHSLTVSPFRTHVHVRTSLHVWAQLRDSWLGTNSLQTNITASLVDKYWLEWISNTLFFKRYILFHLYSCNLFPRHFFVILVSSRNPLDQWGGNFSAEVFRVFFR